MSRCTDMKCELHQYPLTSLPDIGRTSGRGGLKAGALTAPAFRHEDAGVDHVVHEGKYYRGPHLDGGAHVGVNKRIPQSRLVALQDDKITIKLLNGRGKRACYTSGRGPRARARGGR